MSFLLKIDAQNLNHFYSLSYKFYLLLFISFFEVPFNLRQIFIKTISMLGVLVFE